MAKAETEDIYEEGQKVTRQVITQGQEIHEKH